LGRSATEKKNHEKRIIVFWDLMKMIRKNLLPLFFASTLKMEAASSSEIYFYHSVGRQISFTVSVVTTLHLVPKSAFFRKEQ
jgi:hypothetical protein